MLAVFKREMRSYFTSAIGYAFLVIYLLISGAVFCYTTIFSMSANVSNHFVYMLLISGIILPLLTMKSFSEERKLKTEQLLLTSPVSITGMVIGKFLAAFSVYAGALVLSSLYFLFLIPYTQLKIFVLIGNVIAMLLVGMTFISIGVFVSSLTENQLSSAIGTIAIILVFLAIGLVSSLLPSSFFLRFVFDSLSIFTRFQTFSNGYFDFAALFYYLSISAVFLFLTVTVFDKRRTGNN
jgi:ABC-2 type transport system permease protein